MDEGVNYREPRLSGLYEPDLLAITIQINDISIEYI